MKAYRSIVVGLALGMAVAAATGQTKLFSELVGPVPVGSVKAGGALQVPFIIWGGDMATFYANGGLKTKPGTLFHKQGLNLNLTPGDDFIQQVRDYRTGKSPFLRGTFRMMGQASEVIGSDPRTKGVVILQMTWSAGDHMVAREGIKRVTELKGKTVAVQQGGPHIGMLDDVLKTAQLGWDDIEVKFFDALTGPDSPPQAFRDDPSISACFAVTPDMFGLCSDLNSVGTGAEGTVKGAHVLVSTAELSRSIADVYVCRKDFYDANRPLVRKFVAGYLKASEELVDKRAAHDAGNRDQNYINLLNQTVQIYTEAVLPNADEAHGLLLDCTFAGYPGNVSFFEKEGNLHGFEAFQKSSLELATGRGYAKQKMGLLPSGLAYKNDDFLKYLRKTEAVQGERFRAEAVLSEIEELSSGGLLDDRTILSFTINFKANQTEFSAVQYAAEFTRVIEMADKFGNAVVAIRGHADPTKTLIDLIKAGNAKGTLKRSGTRGNYRYALNGQALDLNNTSRLVDAIGAGDFDGVEDYNPRRTMQAALNLSRKRAESVKQSVVEYAKGRGIGIDMSQIQPQGVGIAEPFIAKPRSVDEAGQNMRVEFRLIRVSAEVTQESDFDF
jgi:outer membrane protein OmpA-like peptidoglycan-associated protein